MTLHTLATEMLARLPYPAELRIRVEEMMRAWEAFCVLPDETKAKFGYTKDGRVSGGGYELKKDGSADLKENFHVRRDLSDFLYAEAKRIGAKEMNDFLDAAFAVYPGIDALLSDTMRAIEETQGIKGLLIDTEAGKDTRTIRTLHYFGDRTPGDVLGDPHCDKGGFTIHLHESAPGVERLTREGEWVPMDVHDGEALFFAGLVLQLRSGGKITAPCHRIVANEATAVSGRYSSVAFSPIANTPYYDKERLGRTQLFAAGFNYTMSPQEFSTLFTSA